MSRQAAFLVGMIVGLVIPIAAELLGITTGCSP